MSESGTEVVFPDGEPTSVPAVKAHLGYDESDTSDDDAIELCVDAVNDLVLDLPTAQRSAGLDAWKARTRLGATMLAARLFRRRNSPAGVLPAGSDGIAYVSRNDPDVAQLLDLGDYTKPAVG